MAFTRLTRPQPETEGDVFTYRLYLENGEDLGSLATAVPDWSVGDEFFNSDHNEFRILDIVSGLDDGEFAGARPR